MLNLDNFFYFPGQTYDLFKMLNFMEFDFVDRLSEKIFGTLHTAILGPPIILSCDL